MQKRSVRSEVSLTLPTMPCILPDVIALRCPSYVINKTFSYLTSTPTAPPTMSLALHLQMFTPVFLQDGITQKQEEHFTSMTMKWIAPANGNGPVHFA